MSDKFSLQNLFKAGVTREQFIDNYKQIQNSGENLDGISLFSTEMSDNQIGTVFDFVASDKTGNDNDKLSDNDVKKLASFDGDNKSISDADLNKLYDNMQEAVKKSLVTTNQSDCDTPVMTPAETLDTLKLLRFTKTSTAEMKKTQLKQEIDNLMNKSSKISDELKKEYQETKTKIAQTEQQIKQKEKEAQDNQEKLLSVNEQIARKKGRLNGTTDEKERKSIQNDIDNLSYSATKYKTSDSDIVALNQKLSSYKHNMETIADKVASTDSKTGQEIKNKQNQIKQIDANLQTELKSIDSQIKSAEDMQMKSLMQSSQDSAQYSEIANGKVPDDGHVGKTAAQALSNATSQIGVRELTGHNDGAEIAKYRNGVDNHASWCASFVSWCYKGNNVFGYQASVGGIMSVAKQKGLYSAKGTYTPKAGDVMIQKNGASHTGIVESVDADGTIHTIEGNSSNQVKRCTYKKGSRGYNQISGFVRMSDSEQA